MTPDADKVAAAHRLAWDATMLQGRDRWLHQFQLEQSPSGKATLLLQCPDPDIGTLAIEQLLANDPMQRGAKFTFAAYPAAFAFAAYPAAVAGRLPIGAEAVNDSAASPSRCSPSIGRFRGRSRCRASSPRRRAGRTQIWRNTNRIEQPERRASRTCPATLLLLPRQQRRGQRPRRVRAGVPPLRRGVRRREHRMTSGTAATGEASARATSAYPPRTAGRCRRPCSGMTRARLRCPRVLRVGLDFGDAARSRSPANLLKACGFATSRRPARRWPCRRNRAFAARTSAEPDAGVVTHRGGRALSSNGPRALHRVVLRPARPVLWTKTRASRVNSNCSTDGGLRMNMTAFRNLYRN